MALDLKWFNKEDKLEYRKPHLESAKEDCPHLESAKEDVFNENVG